MEKMNAFHSPVSFNTAEATQKLKEVLNLGQTQSPLAEKPLHYLNGNLESNSAKLFSEDSRMNDTLEKNLQTQHVILKGNNDFHSFEIYGQNVTITASPPNQISGNSKVQIKNIVDYGWEHKYYYGRLVAVHISGMYLAYGGIRLKEGDKYIGIVRVVNLKTGVRLLIKGMTGYVKDIAFSHVLSQIQLAVIDEIGSLFVYNIQEADSKLSCNLALHIVQTDDVKPSDYHRVIWCHYIPDESVDDNDSSSPVEDASKLLVITHDNKAEMLNVDVVSKNYGTGPLLSTNLKTGYQSILEHKQPIIDAAFSPDGTALATASLDGEVKFFQVYMLDDSSSPRCLHQWKPHDGKPLSCIFFLDNHKNRNPEIQFWKFAITGADNNREIKIWCCESWKCLQSLSFDIPPGETLQPCIKAGLDLSASYLLLSDINRKVLYILILYQDIDQNMASVSSLAEFPLPFPMLSYAIVDASYKKYKQLIETENIDDYNNEENETVDDDLHNDVNCFVDGVVVRLNFIQPKSLQQCRIAFQPRISVPYPACSVSSISQESSSTAGFRDRLSDMSFEASIGNGGGEGTATEDLSLNHSILSQSLNSSRQILLTPEAFTSPNHNGTKPPPLPSVFPNETPTSVPLPPVTPSEEANLANPSQEELPLATSEHIEPDHRQSGRSSGSSPSLEVQQIFAPKRASSMEVDEKKFQEVKRRSSKENYENFSKDLTSKVNTTTDQERNNEEIINSLHFTKCHELSTNVMNKEYDLTIWPMAPNLNNELKVISKDSVKDSPSSVSFPNGGGEGDNIPPRASHLPLASEAQPKTEKMDKLEKWLEDISSLHKLLHTTNQELLSQKAELQELRNYMKEQQVQLNVNQNATHHLEKIETIIGTTIERKMNLFRQSDNKQFEEYLRNFENRETQQHERMLVALSQSLTSSMNNKLESVVKVEMRNTLLPVIINSLEPVKEQLKEMLAKILKSKTTVEAIAAATAGAINGYIQSAYKDNFQTILIPAFEKGCQNMFQQINEHFHRGTKEYNQVLENYLEQKRKQNDQAKDPLVHQLQNFLDTFQTSLEHLSTSFAASIQDEMEKQYKSSMATMQELLLQRIQVLMKEEIKYAMKEQQNLIGDSVINAIRSRAVTPTPVTPDPHMVQARILQFIRQGQINNAFQQALNAADLSVVIYVCEKLPPEQVFGKMPCPLEQPVLLSLIQQLSSDLTSHTELKLKYLQEAVINLDKKNPREPVCLAIGLLQKKLQQYMKFNPTSEFIRNMKILHMASQSVLAEYS